MSTPEKQDAPSSAKDMAAIVRKSKTSFYWAMRLLDQDRRAAIYAVYAFCRVVDDIADGPGKPDEKQAELRDWRSEIARVFDGEPQTPIGWALKPVICKYALNQEDFLAVVAGMETDAAGSVRMEDAAALASYVDDVACAVGRLCTPIFGFATDEGDALAKSLGEALQLTNILRDVAEDARQNRLYLPADALEEAGIAKTIGDRDARLIVADPACAVVCNDLARKAQERFDECAIRLSMCDRDKSRAPRLMMMAYRRLLEKIVLRGWRTPGTRISLSAFEKAWLVLRYGLI